MDLLDKLTKIISDIEEGVRSKQQIESRNAKKRVVFSPRLEELIHAALQDGVLTDHEKEVILRRAEKEGEDLDEVEMILKARLAEINNNSGHLSQIVSTDNNTNDFVLPTVEHVEIRQNNKFDQYESKPNEIHIDVDCDSSENANGDKSTNQDTSPIDNYPSELKTIIKMAISENRWIKNLDYEHKQTLLRAAQKFPNVDPYRLLMDAEAAKKQDYYEYEVDDICQKLGWAGILKIYALEEYIMEAKLKFPNNERVKNSIAVAEHILRARKEGRDK